MLIFKTQNEAEQAARALENREKNSGADEPCTYRLRRVRFMGYAVDQVDPDGIVIDPVTTLDGLTDPEESCLVFFPPLA